MTTTARVLVSTIALGSDEADVYGAIASAVTALQDVARKVRFSFARTSHCVQRLRRAGLVRCKLNGPSCWTIGHDPRVAVEITTVGVDSAVAVQPPDAQAETATPAAWRKHPHAMQKIVSDGECWHRENIHPTVEGYKFFERADREMRKKSADGHRPDISALRPLADALTAIYSTPTREQSRRYVDMAVRGLRGEPFAKAIQAVLVALADRFDMWPQLIVDVIDGCRECERRRSEVAPGHRSLTDDQWVDCYAATGVRWFGHGFLGTVYERARAAC